MRLGLCLVWSWVKTVFYPYSSEFSGIDVHMDVQLLQWFTEYTPLGRLLMGVILALSNCYWSLYFMVMIITITGMYHGFRLSENRQSWFCSCSPLGIFLPPDLLSEYWIEHATIGLFYDNSCSLGYLTGKFQALSLSVPLVPWIDHLPPVCWFTFWKSTLNDSSSVNLALGMFYFFLFIHISIFKYRNIS